MATTARLALSAWRNDDVYEVPIRVRGVDLTNIALAMQVRLAPDTPGAPLVDLAKVTTTNTQGLRVAGVAAVDGVPESDLRIRINKATLAGLPYAGELGDGAALSYALLIAGKTRLVGPLTVLAHAYGSDAAPTDRPPSYGAREGGMPAGGALLTIAGDEVTALAIDGADLIEPLAAQTLVARDEVVALLGGADVYTVGIDGTPTAGTESSIFTFVFAPVFSLPAVLVGLRAWATSPGMIQVKRFVPSGSDYVQVGADVPVTLAAGLNVIDEGTLGYIAFEKGERIGFYNGAGITYAGGGGTPFYNGASPGNLSTVTDPDGAGTVEIQIGFDFELGSIAQVKRQIAAAGLDADDRRYLGDRIKAALIDTSALTVTTALTFGRDGAESSHTDTRTLSAPSGSNVRYDVLYIDAETKAFGIVAGTPRLTDAGEYIPAIGASTRIPVAHLRVAASAVTVVPVWQAAGGEIRVLFDDLDAERRLARLLIPRTRALITCGAPLHIVAVGDSIQAIQNAANGGLGSSAPNGPNRDRGAALLADTFHYLRDNLGADLVDAIPLYTAVQLGRPDDGAGAVHTRFGFMWELVAAIQRAGGYALGSGGLLYDNYGIGGAASSDLISGGGLSPWMTNAIALGPDLIVFHFGMNEYGADATESNMVTAITAARAAGIECIVMGVERKRGLPSLADWQETNRRLRRAAGYAGAAFQPAAQIYDNEYLGALGLAAADLCSANANNHPGSREHRIIGAELAKLLIA